MNPPLSFTPSGRRPLAPGARRAPFLFVLALLSGVTAASPASAQETIASDRPGIGSGSTVISPGILQVETGLSFSRSDEIDAWSLGQLFVRYGIAERVEAELLLNSYVFVRGPDGVPGIDADGLEDLAFGAKVRVARGERATFSLQGLVTARTGSSAFTTGEWYGVVNGLFDVALSDVAGLSVNAGVRPGTGDLPTVFNANVTPGVSLGGGFGLYGGWAGSFASGGDVNWLEGGATLLATPDVQLDLNGAWSVDADAWFFGAGVAFRLGANGG